jgi:hypothetical protein
MYESILFSIAFKEPFHRVVPALTAERALRLVARLMTWIRLLILIPKKN